MNYLEVLDVSWCSNVSDRGIFCFVSMTPRLKNLNIAGCTRVTDSGIESFAKKCQNLEVLNVSQIQNVTEKVLGKLAEHCGKLSVLVVSIKKSPTSKNFVEAPPLGSLTSFQLAYSLSYQTLVSEMKIRYPNLQQLVFANCTGFSDAKILQIEALKGSIKDIQIVQCTGEKSARIPDFQYTNGKKVVNDVQIVPRFGRPNDMGMDWYPA